MRNLKKIHLTASGISLAIASLGNLIGLYSTYFKIICGIIAMATLALITLKILVYRQDFMNDLRDINIVSVLPTYFMTIMVLSTYGNVLIGEVNLSKMLWLAAFFFHVSLTFLFIKNHILRFDITKVMPNWFITFVAYAIVGIAAPGYGLKILGQIFIIIGLTCYFILFPIILYRVLVIKQIPENRKPAIWLFNSPINICIVAYMSCFTSLNLVLLLVLLSFSLFSLGFSLFFINLKQILKTGFTPSLSAFTFPTVIFITAVEKLYAFFYENGWVKTNYAGLFTFLEIACVFIVFGILVHYIFYVCKTEG